MMHDESFSQPVSQGVPFDRLGGPRQWLAADDAPIGSQVLHGGVGEHANVRADIENDVAGAQVRAKEIDRLPFELFAKVVEVREGTARTGKDEVESVGAYVHVPTTQSLANLPTDGSGCCPIRVVRVGGMLVYGMQDPTSQHAAWVLADHGCHLTIGFPALASTSPTLIIEAGLNND